MDIQKKALQIIYDITGIVIKWDRRQLTDREDMQEIVRTLASEVENDEKFYEINKKRNPILKEKKILVPVAISVVFFVVLFGANPFTIYEENIIAENSEIRFEQLNEIPNKIDESSLKNEEFGNKTISKED